VVGRCGIDANGEAPVGSTTEHLVRHARCNVLVSGRIAQFAGDELSMPA
jgi:nucleotide-binding universal stress UspA family protein